MMIRNSRMRMMSMTTSLMIMDSPTNGYSSVKVQAMRFAMATEMTIKNSRTKMIPTISLSMTTASPINGYSSKTVSMSLLHSKIQLPLLSKLLHHKRNTVMKSVTETQLMTNN